MSEFKCKRDNRARRSGKRKIVAVFLKTATQTVAVAGLDTRGVWALEMRGS